MQSSMMAWLTWLAYTNERAREAERRGIAEADLPPDPDAPPRRAVLEAATGVVIVAAILLGGLAAIVAELA